MNRPSDGLIEREVGATNVLRPSPHPQAPLPPSGAMDPMGMLRAFRRRWLLASSLGLLTAAAVAVGVHFTTPPPQFTAEARVRVASSPPKILIRTNEPHVDADTYRRTQLAIIRSPRVLEDALKRPEVAALAVVRAKSAPTTWLNAQIQVDYISGSELLRIAVSAEDRDWPAVVVNAVTEAYLTEVIGYERKARLDRRDQLQRKWDDYQEKLRGKREELRNLAVVAGSNDDMTLALLRQKDLERRGSTEDSLRRQGDELRKIEDDLSTYRGRMQVAEAGVTAAETDAALAADPIVVDARARVVQIRAAAELERAKLRGSNLNDPVYRNAVRDLASTQERLDSYLVRTRPKVAAQLREQATAELRTRISELEEGLRVARRNSEYLQEDLAGFEEQNEVATRATVDLASIREEIAHAEAVAEQIGAEIEALGLELDADSRVTLDQRAEKPQIPDEVAPPLKRIGMPAALAFVAVAGGISLMEHRSRKVGSTAEVSEGLGLHVVGTTPFAPSRAGGRNLRDRGLMVESVNAARTALLHLCRTDSIHAVMIGSAVSGEGKTMLSVQLATSLALAGRRTLLIDGDIRRPTGHLLLDVPISPGLCETLRGELDPAAAIRTTAIDRLWMLPAGLVEARAIQALSFGAFGGILDRVRGDFDFIIIDSAPILMVTDGHLIGQHADAVLFSVIQGRSRIPAVDEARRRLANLGVRILGAVVASPEVRMLRYSRGYADPYQTNPEARS